MYFQNVLNNSGLVWIGWTAITSCIKIMTLFAVKCVRNWKQQVIKTVFVRYCVLADVPRVHWKALERDLNWSKSWRINKYTHRERERECGHVIQWQRQVICTHFFLSVSFIRCNFLLSKDVVNDMRSIRTKSLKYIYINDCVYVNSSINCIMYSVLNKLGEIDSFG